MKNKDSLWDRYLRGELPHIHIGKNPLQNVFEDALNIQAERIVENLEKAMPYKSVREIMDMMFGSNEE